MQYTAVDRVRPFADTLPDFHPDFHPDLHLDLHERPTYPDFPPMSGSFFQARFTFVGRLRSTLAIFLARLAWRVAP